MHDKSFTSAVCYNKPDFKTQFFSLNMQIIKKKTHVVEFKKMAQKMFGNMVKAVVDTDKKIMAVNGELHADEEALLLENNSKQENLWGINIYPGAKGDDWIEFDSMINIRPSMNNLSRGIDNAKTRKKVITVVNRLVEK